MAFLPGNIGQRILELRTQHNLSQRTLAKEIGINYATLSKIEKGETKTVTHDILMKLAERFHVSIDFLVGYTCVPDPMSHSMDSLGLTEKAAKAMITQDVHMGMLNRLLENKTFCQLTYTLYYSTEPTRAGAVGSRNNLIGHANSLTSEVLQDTVQKKLEMKALSRELGAELIDPNTIGNMQMLGEFQKVIQQIRRDIREENPVSAPLTRAYFEEMDKELLKKARGIRGNINPRIIAEVFVEKSMVADICTPDQKARFTDLFEEVLTTY